MSPGVIAVAHVRAQAIAVFLVSFAALLFVGAGSANAAFTPTGFSATPTNLQAGGHGNLNISATLNGASAEQSSDDLRSLTIELPAGQLLNPRAVSSTCAESQYGSDTCPSASLVGTITVKYRIFGQLRTASGSVYQLAASADSPLNFGFIVRPSGIQKLWFKSSKVSGMTSVRSGPDGDYGLTITIPQIPYLVKDAIGWQYPITVYDIGIALNQKAPSGKYFVFNPTRCEAATAKAAFTSVRGATISQSSAWAPSGCSAVQFDPLVTVAPTNTAVSAATGINAEFTIDTTDAAIQRSHMRNISVALPPGTTLNLDVLNAAEECSDENIAAGYCPEASKVGTANIDVPFLTAPMVGGIYLNTTSSGTRFVVIVNGPNGTQATFRALSKPTSVDGGSTIVTTFTDLPQAPYSRAQLNFTSELVNNPDTGCPNRWNTIDAVGYSGTAASSTAPHALTGCIPNTVITNPVATPTRVNRPSINFLSDIPGATFMCRLDSGVYEPCTSPYTPPTALADGLHRIVVRAFYGGIGDYSPAHTSFTVDTKAPTLNVTSPAVDAQIDGDKVKFEWTADEPVTVKCALSPFTSTIDDCTSGKTYEGVPAGTYSALISARDAAGNVKATIRTVTVREARINPEITITSPQPGQQMRLDRVSVAYTATSPVGVEIWRVSCEIQRKNGDTWVRVDSLYGCENPDEFRDLPPNTDLRLVVNAEDDNSNEGSASVEFRSGQREPYSLPIDDGPNGTTTNDRTPTFRLDPFTDPLYPTVTHWCALIRPGATTRDWNSCEGLEYTPPTPLDDGDWFFVTRSVSGDRQSTEYRQDFKVGPWNPSYSATLNTTAAGAHPDLDVDIDVPSGQLRKVDMLLPRSVMGSLNSFEQCPASVIAKPADCAPATKIGTIETLIKFQGLNLAPLPGTVYLTAPQVEGDAAGIVILVPKPVDNFGDVVIPMRLQLSQNSTQMRVFSDAIPTQVEWVGQGFYDFYVENFKMHLNGSQGSPYPLLTNPSSCTAGQFSTVIGAFDGEEAPAQVVPFQPTECNALAFAPELTQQFSEMTASSRVNVRAQMEIPTSPSIPTSSLKSIIVLEPEFLGPNYDAFATGLCPGSAAATAASTFNPSSCPASAKFGKMRIVSPLLPNPIVGDVYLINKTPLPWIGVDISAGVETGGAPNQSGIDIKLLATTSLPQVDPGCSEDEEPYFCVSRIRVAFNSLPDLPLSSVDLDLNNAREAQHGLQGELLKTADVCQPESQAITTFTPNSGGAAVTRSQTVSMAGC